MSFWFGKSARTVNDEQGDTRPLPYDIDVEQAVLGALLIDNYWFDRAVLELSVDSFYDPMHQRMFETMVDMWRKGMAVTPITLASLMAADPGLIEIADLPNASGDPKTYIYTLARCAPALPNVKDYLRMLSDLALRRNMARIGEDLASEACRPGAEIGEAMSIAHRAADALFGAARRGDTKRPRRMGVVAMDTLKVHERRLAGGKFPVIPTGFYKLDNEIGGFRGGLMTVIAGRSGMGKSALMGGIALRAALAGYPVLVFSLEMKEEQWVERTLCDIDFMTRTGEPPLRYQHFANGKATVEELDRAARAQIRLAGLPIEIIDNDQLTIEDITALARAYVMDKGELGLIVLDYMQIVVPTVQGRETSREQVVNHIARGSKSLAKQTNWHVIAGCQLINKGLKADDDEKRPTAGDIRESGAIEMEADLILAPWRKAFFLELTRQQSMQSAARKETWWAEWKQYEHKFELLGLKNRHGRKADFELWCEMAASAVRDDAPFTPEAMKAAEAAQGLLIQ